MADTMEQRAFEFAEDSTLGLTEMLADFARSELALIAEKVRGMVSPNRGESLAIDDRNCVLRQVLKLFPPDSALTIAGEKEGGER
jgi:hypothetical protein